MTSVRASMMSEVLQKSWVMGLVSRVSLGLVQTTTWSLVKKSSGNYNLACTLWTSSMFTLIYTVNSKVGSKFHFTLAHLVICWFYHDNFNLQGSHEGLLSVSLDSHLLYRFCTVCFTCSISHTAGMRLW